MVNRHDRTQVRGIRDAVDGVSGTIKHMTTEFSDVREALKAVIPATGDHGGAISVHIGYTDPGKSPDRRLMDAIITDGEDGCCVGIKLGVAF